MQNLFDISGKKAIVTGGTRGLGRGMAEALLEAGCEVVVIGATERAKSAAEAFCAEGYRCYGVQADLGVRDEIARGFAQSLELLGGQLDILVTAHGIQRRHAPEQFPLEDWDAVLDVDLHAVFLLCQLAGKQMLQQGHGKIINIASMISFFGGKNIAAYAAAKGGVAQLTKSLANDWAAKGINVNAIAPGYMDTDLNAALTDPNNPRFQEISARIPMGRWGTGADMKGATIFLASPASDYVTGCILPVDGGYLSC